MVCDSGLHRGRDPQGLMHPAEIVKRMINCNHAAVQPAGERVSHREVACELHRFSPNSALILPPPHQSKSFRGLAIPTLWGPEAGMYFQWFGIGIGDA